MDYSKFISGITGAACVLSLRKDDDGKERIYNVAANNGYIASVGRTPETYKPNVLYTEYIERDYNFEEMCKRCLSTGKITHQYVNAELYNAWIDIYMLPMENDENGNGVCLFAYEMTQKADSDKLIDISARTASTVLKTCIKLRETDDFKVAINSVIKDIRVQCESKGCSLLLTDFEERKCDLLAVDYVEEFGPKDEDVFFKSEFFNIVETWRDFMAGSNCVLIKNENDLNSIKKKAPAWYESLKFSKVDSLVLYPLRIGTKTLGYILVTNFNTDKIEFIKEIMELNAFILSAEISNYLMRTKLEMLGKTDMLTGVLNRNAMNNRVNEIIENETSKLKSYGLVFVDVNGLKETNDTKGHKAGDDMLKHVASKVKSIFENQEVYRVGGDEFLVIAPDIDEDYFDTLVKDLKSKSRVEGEPTFAMGYYYDNNDMDIRKGLQIADKNMYKDKAEYYTSHPKMDRRNR